jgi:hypothetical protein
VKLPQLANKPQEPRPQQLPQLANKPQELKPQQLPQLANKAQEPKPQQLPAPPVSKLSQDQCTQPASKLPGDLLPDASKDPRPGMAAQPKSPKLAAKTSAQVSIL